jgi:putative DNA primase/helicase
MNEAPPKTCNGDLENLPPSLQRLTKERRWVNWRWEGRQDNKTSQFKWTKPPLQPRNLRYAKNNDPQTWDSYERALRQWKNGKADGIGYMLRDSDIAAIDLDKCCRWDAANELYKIKSWAMKLRREAPDAYCEITVSGTGLRLIGIGKGREVHRKFQVMSGSIELYRKTARFISVSGNELTDCIELPLLDDLIDAQLEHYEQEQRSAAPAPASINQDKVAQPDIDALMRDGAPEGERSEKVARVVWYFARRGWSIDKIVAEFAKYPNGLAARYRSEKWLRQDVERCYRKFHAANQQSKILDDLSKLDQVTYELRRKGAAKELGNIRLAALDAEVQRRRELASVEKAIGRSDADRWPEQVNGPKLLRSIYRSLHRHIVVPWQAKVVISLWIVHSHALDAFRISPILMINAPVSECGKTTLMELLETVVPKPYLVSSISQAALFRAIDRIQPTLLIDEADAYLKGNEDLRKLLDSGHKRKSAFISIAVPAGEEGWRDRRFSTWAPKVIAGIDLDRLHQTLKSRSIVIQLERKFAGEKVEDLPDEDSANLDLRRQCARWAEDHLQELRTSKPELGFINRARDNWRPLIAIADLVGGHWGKLAREAAQKLAGKGERELGIELLEDLRDLFERKNVQDLRSSEVLDELVNMEDRAWSEYQYGKPITARQVAKLLSPFNIKPKQLSYNRRPHGYELAQFQSAFGRYLMQG